MRLVGRRLFRLGMMKAGKRSKITRTVLQRFCSLIVPTRSLVFRVYKLYLKKWSVVQNISRAPYLKVNENLSMAENLVLTSAYSLNFIRLLRVVITSVLRGETTQSNRMKFRLVSVRPYVRTDAGRKKTQWGRKKES